MLLTKTNYLLFRDCPQNAWVKIFEPKEYYSNELSSFDKMIMETGNEIDELARELFPGGILIKNRKEMETTMKLVDNREKIIYQPVFFTEKFQAIADMFVWNEKEKAYDIYESKSTNSGENKKKHDRSGHSRLHGSIAIAAFLQYYDPCLPLVRCPRKKES